jgi:hypothetical protein
VGVCVVTITACKKLTWKIVERGATMIGKRTPNAAATNLRIARLLFLQGFVGGCCCFCLLLNGPSSAVLGFSCS